MDANETDALFWRRLLTKYMSRVYQATVDPITGEGETYIASHYEPKMTDEEESMLAQIEKEISYKPNEKIEKRLT